MERLRVEVQQEGIERDLAAVEKKYDDLVAIVTKGEETLSDVENAGVDTRRTGKERNLQVLQWC